MRFALRLLYRAYPFVRGKGRLFEAVRRYLSGRILHQPKGGIARLLDLDNYIDCIIYLDGSYEGPTLEHLERTAADLGCDCFIDVGANVGVYTLHFARNPRFQQIWAFEPDPRNMTQLTANLWLNDLMGRVTLFDLALSSSSGAATFYINRTVRDAGGEQFNTGTSSFKHENSPYHHPMTVETAPLDDVLRLEGRSVLLKIDVEGAEEEVLAGALGLLTRNRCVLMLEIWPDPTDRLGRIMALLTECGYQRMSADLGEDNYLFVPAHTA